MEHPAARMRLLSKKEQRLGFYLATFLLEDVDREERPHADWAGLAVQYRNMPTADMEALRAWANLHRRRRRRYVGEKFFGEERSNVVRARFGNRRCAVDDIGQVRDDARARVVDTHVAPTPTQEAKRLT